MMLKLRRKNSWGMKASADDTTALIYSHRIIHCAKYSPGLNKQTQY